MSKYQELFKSRVNPTDLTSRRTIRVGQHVERQRQIRTSNFWQNRHIFGNPVATSSPKWKIETTRKKRIEKNTKKLIPFKVGVVRHRWYSPPVRSEAKRSRTPRYSREKSKVETLASPPKRITTATQKRLEAKRGNNAAGEKPQQSFAPTNYVFKAPTGLTKIRIASVSRNTDVDNLASDLSEVEKVLQIPWPKSELPPSPRAPVDNSIKKYASELETSRAHPLASSGGQIIIKKSNSTYNFESSIKESTCNVDLREDVIKRENKIDEDLPNSIDPDRADSYDSDVSDDVFESDPIDSNVTIREKLLDTNVNRNDVFDDASKIGESAKPRRHTVVAIAVTDSVPSNDYTYQAFIKINTKGKNTRNKSESMLENNSPASNMQTRILRNRVIFIGAPSGNSPRQRRSKKITIDLNSSNKENQDPETVEPNTSKSADIDDGSAKSDVATRRRSTRRSVRFDDEDCTVRTTRDSRETKTPTTTPRRYRNPSFFGND